MLRLRTAFLVPLVVLVACTSGHADFIFTANLTNSQEPGGIIPTTSTGAPRPASFGTASFVMNDARTTMTFTATIFNIDVLGNITGQTPQTADTNDDLLNAHIHSGPATIGNNNPVVWGFFGAPFNETNPNDSPNALHVIPFTTGVGGTFSGKWDSLTTAPGPEGNGTTLSAQLADIFAGHAYINFHSRQFSGGEIRGQIFLVPEPASAVMAGTATLAGLVSLWWRRRSPR